MRNRIIISLFILIFSFNLEAHVMPSGGSDGNYWSPGSTQYISWSKYFMDTTKNIDIYLWNADSAAFSLIASDVSVASNYYLWDIPQTQETGKHFKVKIVYSNNYRPNFNMFSDDFFPIYTQSEIAELVPTYPNIQIYVVNPNSPVSIYPNPCSTIVTITSNNAFFGLELYNSAGLSVYSNNFNYINTYNLDVSNFTQGSYSLRIKFMGTVVTEQIAIIK